MSGTAILRYLLAARPEVTAITTAARVIAGTVPQNVGMPALSIRQVGDNEEPTMARNMPVRMIRERVQVTALALDYGAMKRLLKAATPGAGVHSGMVLGFKVNSILPAGTNPEMPVGDDEIYEQSRDFVVTFLEAN